MSLIELDSDDAPARALPDPHPGDLIVIGEDRFSVQGEPLRDRGRLVWTLDLRPTN